MHRINYKRLVIWLIHTFCLLLLMGVLWTLFRYASRDNFEAAFRDRAFETTDTFEHLVCSDINDLVDYAELRAKFETDGNPDYSKVVETVTTSDGMTVEYTLQNAVDFGQAIGIVFDAENRLVVSGTSDKHKNSMKDAVGNVEAGGKDLPAEHKEHSGSENVFNYDNYEDFLADRDLEESQENTTLLSLLYRLSEYYEFRSHFGTAENPVSNFSYRLVYIDEDGRTSISTNTDETLNSKTLAEYGIYYRYDSKTKVLESNAGEALCKSIQSYMDSSDLLRQGIYELMVTVDTSYTLADSYTKAAARYENFTDMIHLVIILGGMLVLALALTLIGLISQDQGTLNRFDQWYSESVLLILVMLGLIMYAGIQEVLFSFRTRYMLDLVSGMVLLCMGYLPAIICLLSVFRRIRTGSLVSGFLIWKMIRYIEQNMKQRTAKDSGLLMLIRKLAIPLTNILLMVILMRSIGQGTVMYTVLLVVLLVLVNLVYLGLACRKENQQRRIFRRIEDMTKGQVGHKLDSASMDAENRHLADIVNALDDSLELAVQSRTRSERMQTELIANVSHDLRTPLTSILSYVDLLRMESLPEGRSREYLQVLEDKANRLRSLAEALMDASRATSGTLQIHWMDIDMVQMLNQVMGEFYDRLETQRLETVVQTIRPPAMVRADGKLLWRVFENLFSNVCKYAQPGTRVYIDLQETPQSLVLTMKNISSRKLTQSAEELTERFIRGDVARSTEGSGLGLSIVKNMTEQMHGRFELFLDEDYFRTRLVFPKLSEEETDTVEKNK